MANEYLPGVDITLQDGGLVLPEDKTTESILIIAPSLVADAPDEPKLVRSSTDLVDNGFGDFYVNGKVNTIAAEWKASQDGGNRRTYLSALKGETTKERFLNLQTLLFDVLADFAVDHVVVKGVYSDAEVSDILASDYVGTVFEGAYETNPGMTLYSYVSTGGALTNATVTVGTNDALTITIQKEGSVETDKNIVVPAGVYDGVTLTIEDLLAALNVELSEITETEIEAVLDESGRITLLAKDKFTVKSGTALAPLALTAAVGKVAVWTVHSKGQVVRGSFGKLLGQYAEEQTLNNTSTLAFIGVTPPSDVSMRGIKAYVDALISKNNEYSKYVSVIAQEVAIQLPVTNSTYWTNAATHYSALVSTLRPESAPTNKPLKGVKAVKYNYSVRQLNALNGKKYVVFNLKDGNLVVVEGKTTAPHLKVGMASVASNYAQISTLRITQTAIDVVREACEPFIGEPNEMPQYNALKAAINGALKGMLEAGALQDYKFSVSASSATLDSARVALSIVPMFELRRISVDVNLRPPTLLTV